ncbi:MAG: Mut7-C RNAse domain-containing protein [Candidatus Omnitrophica bacterium]|nr:Mut7-C RNAse domain-containing protein [Candidatus Omnitrophota bacterium]
MEESLKFITTIELGRLARWLRILGYDCVFFDRAKKKDLVIESLREGRIILTRDSRLSRFSGVRMVHIESDFVEEQLNQAIKSLRLKVDKEKIFTRCVKCNTPIEKAEKEDLESKVPPYVYKTQEEFMCCPNCGKVYWKGTHWRLANKFMEKIEI